jgi:hypothetical protein
MTDKHMKKCSTSLTMKGSVNQKILRFYRTIMRMAIIKKTNNNRTAGVAQMVKVLASKHGSLNSTPSATKK